MVFRSPETHFQLIFSSGEITRKDDSDFPLQKLINTKK